MLKLYILPLPRQVNSPILLAIITNSTDVSSTPIYIGQSVAWSHEWPMGAALRPNRAIPGLADDGNAQGDAGDEEMGSEDSEGQRIDPVTGHGDPMEVYFGVDGESN
jgi:hypothetical protein